MGWYNHLLNGRPTYEKTLIISTLAILSFNMTSNTLCITLCSCPKTTATINVIKGTRYSV